MSIIRVHKEKNFSIMSNVHLQDESISWKAKGILSYLLSKPEDWQVYISHLKNQSTDGRDATASGIRELIDAGYITREYTRNEAGQIIGRDYAVHETALSEMAQEEPVNSADNPKTENPTLDNPTLGNPELPKTDYTKNGLKENTDDVPPPEPNPAPQENEPEPSSSFSKSDLVKTVAALMTLVPEKFQKTSVENTIGDALGAYTVDYVRTAILYTTAMSNGGTIQKFRSYLGQCLEKHWHKNWTPEEQPDQTAIRDEFKNMADNVLEMLADAGNQFAMDELDRRADAVNS